MAARYVFAVLLVAAAAAGGYWFYAPQATTASTARYLTSPLGRGTIRRTVATSGPVRALVTVQVGSQLSGQVIDVKSDFNTVVKAGDVMAILDPKTFQVRVQQAAADLAAARANLAHQKAALEKAEAVRRQALRNMNRHKRLASRGVTSGALLDTSVRDAEVAAADIELARAQILVATAQVAQREALLRQTQIDLDRTSIRAPIDGTVISRTVEPGQTVAASLQSPELFKIAQDLSRIRIEAQVNEADVGAIAPGNPATFTVDAYPERLFRGQVTQIRLAATELQSVVTYTVIIEASNEDRRLFPGMTANVEIETARRPDVLRLPGEALRFKPRDAAAAGNRSREDRRQRWRRRLARLQKDLGLDDQQAGAIGTGLRSITREMRSAGGGADGTGQGSGGPGRREVFRSRFEQLVKSVLRPDQSAAFERWRKQRRRVRIGTVWVLGSEGRPERRQVRIGIADENFVEIVGGRLRQGDAVIVRERRAP